MIPQNFLKAIASEHKVSSAELEVLSLAMQGESVANMSQNLHISEDAVRKRLSEVYQKFQIPGRGPVKLTKLQQHLIRQYQARANLQSIFSDSQAVSFPNRETNQLGNYIDWDSAPDVSVFFGRTAELATLSDWIVNQRCRLVALLGMGGMGKTALAVKLARQIQEQFDYLVWRSLGSVPTLEELLTDIIKSLHPEGEIKHLNTIEQKISWLIAHFQSYRCLIILDGVEAILSQNKLVGTYSQGYENYSYFFRRLGEEASKSCVFLTSREKVGEISFLEGAIFPVRSWQLSGLGQNARLLLQEKGLLGDRDWDVLIESYRGNPLMLKLAATTIQEVFDGNVSEFLSTTLFPNNVTDFVGKMIERLSELELKVLVEIASQEKPMTLSELITHLNNFRTKDVISSVTSLRQRSLLEKSPSGFLLPPVVKDVIS
jgi:DNA-binding CsgD family transcriptional regulator